MLVGPVGVLLRMKEIESLNKPESESYVYVRERAAMETLIERIASAERVALDTEADSLHNYFEKVCLIQLSLGDEHYSSILLLGWT